ncbi:MAG: gamma-glutamyl-gamma-aminobutyrate hydrolase family protein [Ginsengibacter sp.]
MKRKLTFGITDCARYYNYENWFINTGKNVEVIKLCYQVNNINSIEECAGIVLSGGEDVHPNLYNKPEYLSLLNKKNIDDKRDEFEWKVIEKSFELKKPVPGICRGLQMINIFLGGTLFYDIPASLSKFEHDKIEEDDQLHTVNVAKNSLLYNIARQESGEINSAHHQSVDTVAEDLEVIAHSSSVIEGLQWKKPENKSWLLLVQWHPERMADQRSPFASGIKKEFIKRCYQ